MRILYHYPLCPFSRKIRFLLAEKRLDIALEESSFWKKTPEFIKLNPLGQVPILSDLQDQVICDSAVIAEYLEEMYPERSFLGTLVSERTEVRRICAWFDGKFANDVTLPLLKEKLLKRLGAIVGSRGTNAGPDSGVIRAAKVASLQHLHYLGWIIERRTWLAGHFFSLADITAAAHISSIDYLGDIAWEKVPLVHQWYARIKSRPTFRSFFKDRIPGITPSSHYENLDF